MSRPEDNDMTSIPGLATSSAAFTDAITQLVANVEDDDHASSSPSLVSIPKAQLIAALHEHGLVVK